jgi:hypothetical protein
MTKDGLLLDYWTAHYAHETASGKSTFEAENTDFDLDAILDSLGDEDDDDQWEDQPHLSA